MLGIFSKVGVVMWADCVAPLHCSGQGLRCAMFEPDAEWQVANGGAWQVGAEAGVEWNSRETNQATQFWDWRLGSPTP